uniref:Uncharacterized protein n=1 Tax=Triticum urartu TaxID=4572 RepID=A0A8R7P747_TRIUA
MAALRVTARRLVGGGQTPVVAVDKVQRRLFPRLSQVDRARSTTSSAAAAAKVLYPRRLTNFISFLCDCFCNLD